MCPYKDMTDAGLRHTFCSRVPDLYMDLLCLAIGMPREKLIELLTVMDRDASRGKRGPLFYRPVIGE